MEEMATMERTDEVMVAGTAIVTGGSQGFGFALSQALRAQGWRVVIDARDGARLAAAVELLGAATPADGAATGSARLQAVAGDVTDGEHRAHLVAAAGERLDLVVLNASELGPSPLPPLAAHPLEALERVLLVNVAAPVGLIQVALPLLVRSPAPTVVTISSDAAVEAYAGWGVYGASKAALDHVAAVLAVEEPALRVYAFDPGDMRTGMQQRAFPEEDISDRAAPAEVVPALLRLLARRPPSGRFTAHDLRTGQPA